MPGRYDPVKFPSRFVWVQRHKCYPDTHSIRHPSFFKGRYSGIGTGESYMYIRCPKFVEKIVVWLQRRGFLCPRWWDLDDDYCMVIAHKEEQADGE